MATTTRRQLTLAAPVLESALAEFARYYMGNDDPDGMASDLLIILNEYVDTDALYGLAQRLSDEVSDAVDIDAQDEPDA
jgi:hypothetical protein